VAALLPILGGPPHPAAMFAVDEATAAAIRIAFERGGELSAVAELRRHFPLITDNGDARRCGRDRLLKAAAPDARNPAEAPDAASRWVIK
jgi:hypothetical protein